MTDKMPDEIYAWKDPAKYCDSWSANNQWYTRSNKYISEQKHAEEITALRAEHRAEISLIIAENQSLVNAMQLSNKQALAGLCDEIKESIQEFNSKAGFISGDTVHHCINKIKQRISDE